MTTNGKTDAKKEGVRRPDLRKFEAMADLSNRYETQLNRLRKKGLETVHIDDAVGATLENLQAGSRSLVIYGEPQSGKTEMMICLTAKLLDAKYPIIIHLMNDNVSLLSQNLTRFRTSTLIPPPQLTADLPQGPVAEEVIIFCKKNTHDLERLERCLEGLGPVVIIDDEADYATPNPKINKGEVSKINERIGRLLGDRGIYIGVTATPARLDLNNTFETDTEKWVRFGTHDSYTGQEAFFPLDQESPKQYRLFLLENAGPDQMQTALVRFMVTVAYLNTQTEVASRLGEKWTMLVHTSGRKLDHAADLQAINDFVQALHKSTDPRFADAVARVYDVAQQLYPSTDADDLTGYIIQNISQVQTIVLNTDRDQKMYGDRATTPSTPFTIIIGGNIVSRGVTFPNLLAMFFSRDTKTKLQQDTYIQRARMFGDRRDYLAHFELTIPRTLYEEWMRCFIFHRLALATISRDMRAPVWLADRRISAVASSSIDRSTVQMDKGEMSFEMFDYNDRLEAIISKGDTSLASLEELGRHLGEAALPRFLIEYIRAFSANRQGGLAIHPSASIERYTDKFDGSTNKMTVYRRQGFMGTSQLARGKFPGAVHHIRIHYNAARKARVFYKYTAGIQFIKNENNLLAFPGQPPA